MQIQKGEHIYISIIPLATDLGAFQLYSKTLKDNKSDYYQDCRPKKKRNK